MDLNEVTEIYITHKFNANNAPDVSNPANIIPKSVDLM
jgi:hypothetical protein